jgi:hypothetical protein
MINLKNLPQMILLHPQQGLDQDNHEEDDEPNYQDQEESNDQGGDEDDGDKREAPPHSRVRQDV